MSTAGQDRLFVPLSAKAFAMWQTGLKQWEVRRDVKRWWPPHTRRGRRVELRRGYSGPSLWGTVGGFLRSALVNLPGHGIRWSDVAPYPGYPESALSWRALGRVMGISDPGTLVVAFEIVLDTGQVGG